MIGIVLTAYFGYFRTNVSNMGIFRVLRWFEGGIFIMSLYIDPKNPFRGFGGLLNIMIIMRNA